MMWNDYLSQIVVALLTLWVLKITYIFIKRRYAQSSVVHENSTKESDIYASNEKLFNESSLESLNLDHEKKIMNINNDTGCSGYGSTEDEMQENKNYTTTQDVLNTYKFDSDSFSSNISWVSCKEGISHPELNLVNCQPSEIHPEICQPLNLCLRDNKNETVTNKITRTFFTDRKHKSIKGVQKINSEKYSVPKMIGDYDQQCSSLGYEKMKNLDCFENKEHSLNNDQVVYNVDNTEDGNNLEMMKVSLIYESELEDYYNLDNTEHELKNENYLEITEISSIFHDELKDENSLDDTDHELKNENNLEITKLSSTYQSELENENILDNTEHELKNENNLEITKLSSTYQSELENENILDNTYQSELEDGKKLDSIQLSSIYYGELEDEYNLDNTEHELKKVNYLEITEISSIYHDESKDKNSLDNTEYELKDENNLEITECSFKHHEELEHEYSLDNSEHSSNNDDVMLGNDLETTGITPVHHDEQSSKYNYLKSPELSFINTDKSISGIDSPNTKCHDYEVQDITGLNNTSSSESTESFPSPIFYDDSSMDDIRYVEDYNDISFYDPTFSDDALNEAFVED